MAGLEPLQSIRILGHRVHMVENFDVVVQMERWIGAEGRSCHVVVNTGMHGIMEGHRNPTFKAMLNSADLFVPDGILVVLLARLRGFKIKKKNVGPDLMRQFFQHTARKEFKHYFYGDTKDTLQTLEYTLRASFPNAEVAGLASPPFRSLTPEEDEADVQAINQAKPDVLWVSLGAPKQERWMIEHRDRLTLPVVVGCGAAFKFFGGDVKRAPLWLRNNGLEWAWRMLQEPRRIGRRVLIDAPQFIGLVLLEIGGLKKYS